MRLTIIYGFAEVELVNVFKIREYSGMLEFEKEE